MQGNGKIQTKMKTTIHQQNQAQENHRLQKQRAGILKQILFYMFKKIEEILSMFSQDMKDLKDPY